MPVVRFGVRRLLDGVETHVESAQDGGERLTAAAASTSPARALDSGAASERRPARSSAEVVTSASDMA
ncbi:hypothetical protein [Streptomyces sp. NPDC052042]|uniref:hypothetical protein n=1 Tax=Streptomyces sp. NPDC052042 TaxID=3365683 RepID=UPI0037D3F646